MDGVECRAVPGKGVGLFAARDFEAGSVIMKETPLLEIDLGKFARDDKLERTCKKHRVPCEIFLAPFAVLRASAAVQAKVEELFCPDDSHLDAFTHTQEQFGILKGCLDELDAVGALPSNVTVAQFWKMLLICQCNAVEAGDKLALFSTFSRGNHSCRPSAWHCMQRGEKVLRAVRPLKSGDEITYSYLGLEDLLKGAEQRNLELQRTKCFTCDCSECCIDRSRAFQCPKCQSIAVACSDGGGVDLRCQNEACGASFDQEARARALNEEKSCVHTALELPGIIQQKHGGDPRKAMEEIVQLAGRFSASLHPQHWVVHCMNLMLRDLHKYVLRSPPEKTVQVMQKMLDYTKRIYPGVSYCVAMQLVDLAEECLKSSASGAGLITQLLLAQESASEALRLVEICNGPEHESATALKNLLAKVERGLSAVKCANSGCTKKRDMLCARCKMVGDCSSECQKAACKARHKTVCKK
eukprot:TRINITY_DN92359_c0_g1_i1.p1 TRINITY_DN92359_c0_g1~~TRINITY_DN92359_c0_g1_i1.p1  ORF type:complete len:481 (+),score=100.44 TRINITY_DN92359_c0_g1_i1:34-1443(+)